MRLFWAAATMLLALVLPTGPEAQCIMYGDYVHYLGGYDTPGDAGDVTAVGDLVYQCCEGYSSAETFLKVIDISNPRAPQTRGYYDFSLGSPKTVSVNDGLAYIGLGRSYGGPDSEFVILDVSNPSVIARLGSVVVGEWPLIIALRGDYAYVANDGDGLRIIDISDPALPQIVGHLDFTGRSFCVALKDDIAYVGNSASVANLKVVDIGNPAAPQLLNQVNYYGGAYALIVDGDILFAASGSEGISVFDLGDPEDPTIIANFDMEAQSFDIALAGNILFSAGGARGWQILDVSDPLNIIFRSDFNNGPGETYNIAVTNDIAILPSYNGRSVLLADIDPPHGVEVISNVEAPGEHYDLVQHGGIASVASGTAGLQVFDVHNPLSASLLGSLGAAQSVKEVAMAGSFAYIAEEWQEFENLYSSFHVVDISDPTSPALRGSLPELDNGCNAIALYGSYAYTVSGRTLRVIAIDNPDNPLLVETQISAPLSGATDIAIHFSHAYVSDTNVGLVVYDLANPASPLPTGTATVSGFPTSVTYWVGYAYLCTANGWAVVDVADPFAPALLGRAAPFFELWGPSVIYNYIGYASYRGGLLVFEMFDPAEPALIGAINVPGDVFGLDNYYEYLLSAGGAGLSYLPSECIDVDAVDDTAAAATLLSAPWPNPFNPHTTLKLQLSSTQRVRLTINDVSGRRVRMLADQVFEAGSHDFVWRGRDEAGRMLPSGIYFAKISAGAIEEMQKLVLLR